MNSNSFNANLIAWDVSSCQNFVEMFKAATVFDSSVAHWKFSYEATHFRGMFSGATSFTGIGLETW